MSHSEQARQCIAARHLVMSVCVCAHAGSYNSSTESGGVVESGLLHLISSLILLTQSSMNTYCSKKSQHNGRYKGQYKGQGPVEDSIRMRRRVCWGSRGREGVLRGGGVGAREAR